MSLEAKTNLEVICAQIDKKYGKGSVMKMSEKVPFQPDQIISTGSIQLDTALGIGGYKKGRIVEVFGQSSTGKTTLCLHAIANAQKMELNCLFIDAEHSLDLNYAKSLEINTDELLLAQPDYGEQALDIVDTFVRSGEVGLIIVDSVAALVPQKELEGEIGDSVIGLQARIMSQAMRKMAGPCSKTGCTVIFVNQIRQKIGVMWGCFHYDAKILLEDGTTEKIGKIVNQEIKTNVLSVSKEGKIETKPIVGWHKNGKANRFFNIIAEYPHGRGRTSIPVGDDHILITPSGERHAVDLKIGDKVYVKSTSYLNNIQLEYAIGTFLGDGSIKLNDAENTARLRLGHGKNQSQYLEYKKRIFGNYISTSSTHKNGAVSAESHCTNELVWLAQYKHQKALQYIDNELASKITARSIAFWYLDDGTFSGSYIRWGWGKSEICATKLDENSKLIIANRMKEIGFPKPTITKRGFLFSGKRNKLFQSLINDYIPECMHYKIHSKLRRYNHEETEILENYQRDVLIEAKIVDIYDRIAGKNNKNKFDITVEDNHCYFVDNTLVHNSPNITSGGKALQFYASQRLEIKRTGNVTKGDKTIGNKTKVVVVKNKLAPPKTEVEFNILFGKGIDTDSELLSLAVEDKIIIQKGSWYSYKEGNIAQGEVNALVWLKENPEIQKSIQQEIINNRGIK